MRIRGCLLFRILLLFSCPVHLNCHHRCLLFLCFREILMMMEFRGLFQLVLPIFGWIWYTISLFGSLVLLSFLLSILRLFLAFRQLQLFCYRVFFFIILLFVIVQVHHLVLKGCFRFWLHCFCPLWTIFRSISHLQLCSNLNFGTSSSD